MMQNWLLRADSSNYCIEIIMTPEMVLLIKLNDANNVAGSVNMATMDNDDLFSCDCV